MEFFRKFLPKIKHRCFRGDFGDFGGLIHGDILLYFALIGKWFPVMFGFFDDLCFGVLGLDSAYVWVF